MVYNINIQFVNEVVYLVIWSLTISQIIVTYRSCIADYILEPNVIFRTSDNCSYDVKVLLFKSLFTSFYCTPFVMDFRVS